jgi:serine/threonine protein kinase
MSSKYLPLYSTEDVIGTGTYGIVYKSADGRKAIKRVKLEESDDELSNFDREALVTEHMSQLGIGVKLHDAVKVDEYNGFLVLDLAEMNGEDLLYEISQPEDFEQVVEAMIKISNNVLMKSDFICFDIKPNNFLFLNGKLYMSDFDSCLPKKQFIDIALKDLQKHGERYTENDVLNALKIVFTLQILKSAERAPLFSSSSSIVKSIDAKAKEPKMKRLLKYIAKSHPWGGNWQAWY